jgi:hypothetical protein
MHEIRLSHLSLRLWLNTGEGREVVALPERWPQSHLSRLKR